jgi:ATP-dependent helicase HrpB
LDLPITPHRERIVSELERAGCLVLSAPTGSGKSTQVPRYLRGRVKGRVLVLEPRRLSARSLAQRVAQEEKVPLGSKVGYQVRFDSRCGPGTEVVFQTYGLFVAQLLQDPKLSGVGAVLLDEFHERTLDADLALAWLKALRRERPELKLVVMSATLEPGELRSYLPGAAAVDVPGRLHPVKVSHHPLTAREGAAEGTLAALRELAKQGLDGSVLVFLPGLREIRRARAVLTPWCREQGLGLHALHGSMELSEQSAVMEEGAAKVILATNVAETGLTIPGVTAVIDSGLHRVAAHDAARGINTLYVARISRANAAQRAGRAGRTAPGRCVRLWSLADEAGMAPGLKPEMSRLELSSLRLQAASLPGPVDWLTPPPEAAWAAAGRSLEALGAVKDGRITARGRALLRYPAPPRVAAVLEDARALGPEGYERACAMAALFESEARRPDAALDLSAAASDLLAGGRDEAGREAFEAFKQLRRLGEDLPSARPAADALPRLWLDAFGDRLAAAEGEGGFYRLADGRGALLPGAGGGSAGKGGPPLLLALDVRERAGGGQARQVAISLFLPFTVDAVKSAFPGEAAWTEAAEFDARKGRVVREQRLSFRGLVLERRELTESGRADKKAAAELWAEKFATGELRHPGFDEKVPQYLVRLALARRLYPDMGFPELGPDDWRLIYGELCHGKNSLKDIEKVPLLPQVEAYLGKPLAGFLDKALPESKRLPNGRSGKFLYHETHPAELSARLGDFVGLKGTMALCEGRLPVIFDILAPNYRTVQKTADLSSFWANTYPTVKKELQRRYPRHPWP